MFSPYACISALFDGINHLLLLAAFRLGPAPAMFHLANNDRMFNHQHYLLASIVLMSSIVFFGTKAIHAGLAKWAVSKNLFWQDAFSFWSMLETVPLVAVVISSLSVDMVLHQRATRTDHDDEVPFALRTLIACTTPFLWLRILAYIKIRNKQLATFILCSVEIMKVGESTLSSYEFCELNNFSGHQLVPCSAVRGPLQLCSDVGDSYYGVQSGQEQWLLYDWLPQGVHDDAWRP